MSARTRILLTKPTHDCHDRGVRLLARRLRDAGYEVIFTNFLLPTEIVSTAVQEDVDAIGISSSSGGHMAVFEGLMEGLRDAGATDMIVLGGGVIPDEDAEKLRDWGVASVFGPGSSPDQVIEFVREKVATRRERPS